MAELSSTELSAHAIIQQLQILTTFDNGGEWCLFDEVDMKPGSNAGVFDYGKEMKGEPVERRRYCGCKTSVQG